ncbi:MAG: hypothetical protein JSS27_13000 [Planctomycetes bacterium]|nr:hypothetical protein [Planctomycetota bacterium]
MSKQLHNSRRGQAMVEYAIIIGAVVLMGIGAMSLLGHKATDLVGITTALLPGAHADDNGVIFSGELVQTTNSSGVINVTGTPGSTSASLGIANGSTLVSDTADGSGS